MEGKKPTVTLSLTMARISHPIPLMQHMEVP